MLLERINLNMENSEKLYHTEKKYVLKSIPLNPFPVNKMTPDIPWSDSLTQLW